MKYVKNLLALSILLSQGVVFGAANDLDGLVYGDLTMSTEPSAMYEPIVTLSDELGKETISPRTLCLGNHFEQTVALKDVCQIDSNFPAYVSDTLGSFMGLTGKATLLLKGKVNPKEEHVVVEIQPQAIVIKDRTPMTQSEKSGSYKTAAFIRELKKRNYSDREIYFMVTNKPGALAQDAIKQGINAERRVDYFNDSYATMEVSYDGISDDFAPICSGASLKGCRPEGSKDRLVVSFGTPKTLSENFGASVDEKIKFWTSYQSNLKEAGKALAQDIYDRNTQRDYPFDDGCNLVLRTNVNGSTTSVCKPVSPQIQKAVIHRVLMGSKNPDKYFQHLERVYGTITRGSAVPKSLVPQGPSELSLMAAEISVLLKECKEEQPKQNLLTEANLPSEQCLSKFENKSDDPTMSGLIAVLEEEAKAIYSQEDNIPKEKEEEEESNSTNGITHRPVKQRSQIDTQEAEKLKRFLEGDDASYSMIFGKK